MSHEGNRRGLSLLLAIAILATFAGAVAADSSDPTSVNVFTNGNTVTLSGLWTWPRCEETLGSDRWVGWAVDWDEPAFTGNVLPSGAHPLDPYHMGEAGTYPTTQGNHVFSPLDNNAPSNCASIAGGGTWGPISHTYSAPGEYHACVVLYDVSATASTGIQSRLAGGPDRNADNSVEVNNTEIENCTPITIIIPSEPGLATQVSSAVADVGDSVTDVANLTETGSNGQVTGEVDFLVCFTAAAASCTTGGADAGANTPVVDNGPGDDNGTATSNAVQLTEVGWYCFRAEYDSLDSVHYLDTTHSDATDECVQAVPLPTISVDKSAVPTSKGEPGGTFTFNVVVTNTSNESVSLTTLTDDIYGNLNGQGTCDVTPPVVLAANATYNCSFDGAFTGDAGNDQTDVVTATAVDSDNNQATDTDGATVTLTDVLPTINVTKTAAPTSLSEPGGNVTYTVTVQNTSVEIVTLTTLTDSKFGDLDGKGNCDVTPPVVLAISGAGSSYTCSFMQAISGDAGQTHTNLATGIAVDDENNTATDTDDADVTFLNVNPTINVDKTASSINVNEPGGTSTFTVTVTNNSVESVSLHTLSDDKFGNVDGQGNCDVTPPVVLAPAATYTCSFQGTVSGNAGFVHIDTVTATANDNENNQASDTDTATVAVLNINPSLTVVKTASPLSQGEPGGTFTFSVTVTNTSVEPVSIVSLVDNIYGNLATKGTCTTAVGTVLAALTGSYSCSFTGPFAGDAGASQTDTITATVKDDENNESSNFDDATVTLTNVNPTVQVDKSASPTTASVGDTVTFSVSITNTSVEPVTLTTLTDDKFGNLNGKGTCATGGTIAAGAVYSCTFTAPMPSGLPGGAHANIVTGTVRDNENNTATDTGTATVTVQPGAIQIDKVADAASVPAGSPIGFTVKVTNAGTGIAKGVTVTDTLPVGAGLNWSLVDNAAGKCALAAGKVTCGPLDLAAGATFTFHVTSPTTLATAAISPVKNIAVVTTTNDGGGQDEDQVVVPSLVVDKGNNAAVMGGVPIASAGSTVLFTLSYDVGSSPVASAVITDVVPVGLEYVGGSATVNATFTFAGYDPATRTLSWTAASAAADGSVAYGVVVQAGASGLPQPLRNLATIDSPATAPSEDQSDVFVPPPPAAATAKVTLPPSDTTGSGGSSSPASSLPLVLAGLGALILALAFATPVPATVRRRHQRR